MHLRRQKTLAVRLWKTDTPTGSGSTKVLKKKNKKKLEKRCGIVFANRPTVLRFTYKGALDSAPTTRTDVSERVSVILARDDEDDLF